MTFEMIDTDYNAQGVYYFLFSELVETERFPIKNMSRATNAQVKTKIDLFGIFSPITILTNLFHSLRAHCILNEIVSASMLTRLV